MNEYTPTTEEVRTDYVMAYDEAQSSQLEAQIAFDRWLVARDAETRRQALEEAICRIQGTARGEDGPRRWAFEEAILSVRSLAEGADQ